MAPSTSFLLAVSLLTACFAPAAAQTWSACNPMNVTNCPDNPALGMSYNYDFSNAANASTWNATAGMVTYGAQGASFTVNKRFDSPTIQSEFYIMFGTVEVHMQGATGQGIISSIVLESDDLDEVDWEFIGGNNTHVETNYFGKGNTTSFDRAIYYPVNNLLHSFHNYTVHWTKDVIEWYIDGSLTRTLHYKDALGGYNFPQTPMNVRLGIWAGGDKDNSNGTIEWAGGLTDYDAGPYTMLVKSIKVQDYGSGKAYHWSDKTGSYQSIKSVAGNSTVAETLNAPPVVHESFSDKWNKMPSGAKIGIYSGAGVAAAAIVGAFLFFCIRQRRAGKKEQAEYAAQQERDRLEAEAFKKDHKDPDALPSSATPDQYNHLGQESYFEKPGQFGSGVPAMPTPPPAYGNMNNGTRSPTGPYGSQSGSLLNGPLPMEPLDRNRSPGPAGPLPNLPTDRTRSPGFNGDGFEPARLGTSHSARSNMTGISDARSVSANGPLSPQGFNQNSGYIDAPRLGNSSPRPGNGSPRLNGPGPNPMRQDSGGFSQSRGLTGPNGPPRMGNGPPPLRNNSGGFNNGPGYGQGNYGSGGLPSPNAPGGYANGGLPSPSNFSRPGNFSPRSQSPRMPLVQSPTEYYSPAPQQQYGGSSGGNFFTNPGNGYGRPGAF